MNSHSAKGTSRTRPVKGRVFSKEPCLVCESVSIAYGKHIAVKNVSLDLHTNEVIAVIGPNGSGKSSILLALAGLIKPVNGNILCNGTNIQSLNERSLAKMRSCVFDDRGILPDFTVCEFISQRFYAHLLSPFDSPDADSVFRSAEEAGIAHLLDRPLSALSSGERALVSIAGAIAQNHEIILLDEPTAHLDIKHSLEIISLLSRLRDKGSAIIIVLHDINAALSFADRVILLDKGSISFNGTPHALVKSGKIDMVFGVKSKTVHNKNSRKPVLSFSLP